MKLSILTIVRFILLASLGATCHATTYFVATTGSDTNPGTNAQPFATLPRALTAVTPGDIISIGSGTFSGSANTSVAGTGQANRITISGAGVGLTIYTGTLTIDSDYYTISGITFRGESVTFDNANYAIIQNCEAYRGQNNLKINGGSNCIARNNIFRRAGANGMVNVSGTGHLLEGNTYQNNNGNDANRANNAIGCIWRGNLFTALGPPNNNITTSISSNTIGPGTKVFEVAAGLGYEIDDFVRIESSANVSNYLRCWVVSYSGTTLTVDVLTPAGSGTYASWNIRTEAQGNHADIMQAFTFDSHDNLFERNRIYNCDTQLGNISQDGNPNIRDWTFRNNIFWNSRIQMNVYAPGFRFYNNTIYNTPLTTGFRGATDPSAGNGIPILVYNNIFCRVGNIESGGPYNGATADYNLITDFDDSIKTGYNEIHGINGGYTPQQIFIDPDNGDFRLRVDSPAVDSGTDLSATFTDDQSGSNRPLGVAWDIGAFEQVPPTIPVMITQPVTNQVVGPGTTVTISALARGAAPLTSQWKKNGTNLTNGGSVSGATNPTLTLTAVTSSDTATYTYVATNGSGFVTSNGSSLTVTDAAYITVQPVGLTANEGTNVSFATTAVGNPAPTYQWRRNGVNLVNGSGISGATSATLSLTGITGASAGTYSVVATNSLGTSTSTGAVLAVNTIPVFTTQPISQNVALGGTAVFSAVATSTPTPTYQWRKDGANLAGQTGTTLTLPGISLASTGVYTCIATSFAGSTTSSGAGLNMANVPPSAVIQPASTTVLSGSTAIISFTVNGTPTPTIQWFRNGVAIPGATNATLTLNAATKAANAGTYTATATNSTGSITSSPAVLAVQVPSRLSNVSTRAGAGSASQTLIAGFVINGGSKSILVRTIGPGFAQYFPAGATLVDPQLNLLDGQTLIQSNDNWGGTTPLKDLYTQLGAFALPDASQDSAIVATLQPNKAFSAVVNGGDGGLALAEVYDADSSETPAGRLVNLSTRTQVGTGANVLIAGFVIAGDFPKQVMIRAIGPTLAQYGVTGVLADPILDLYVAGGTIPTQSNDNWGGTAPLIAAFNQVGAFGLPDLNSKDAVLLVTLNPGAYSAIVSGVNNTTGVALVEIYEMP